MRRKDYSRMVSLAKISVNQRFDRIVTAKKSLPPEDGVPAKLSFLKSLTQAPTSLGKKKSNRSTKR